MPSLTGTLIVPAVMVVVGLKNKLPLAFEIGHNLLG